MVTVFREFKHFLRSAGLRRVALLSPDLFARAARASLACALFACAANAQQPARHVSGRTGVVASTPPTAAQAARRARTESIAQAAPPVVAVVHRLRGWSLRAVVAPPDAPIPSTFDNNFVRTNIVAGYVLADGRSVVARLPQAEAEMLNFSAMFPEMKSHELPGESSLNLIRTDGAQFAAKFIGMDASTGLALLETEQRLLPSKSDVETALVIGQRICVYAPLPAEAPDMETARAATPANVATVGDAGQLYMNLSEFDGTLREVRRSPTGRVIGFSLQTDEVSPEWSGGVALTESGAFVGIVDQSAGRETRILSAASVRAAASRVRTRRASVPQPWLGARGDAVAMTSPELFVSHGWSRAQASTLFRRQQGVMLTSVAPGTPAARAGLRPGDVIARVGNHDVRNIEDLTLMLKELGGNAPTQFTVLRAGSLPMNLRVLLSEAQNPALETAQAEMRAAESELAQLRARVRSIETEVFELQKALRRIEEKGTPAGELPAAIGAPGKGFEMNRVALREKLRLKQERLMQTNLSLASMQHLLAETQARLLAASAAQPAFAVRPLLHLGVETVAFSSVKSINGVTTSRKGLMVVALQPDGAAARAGVRVGDLVETVNDQASLGIDWKTKLPADPKTEVTLGIARDDQKIAITLRPPAPGK